MTSADCWSLLGPLCRPEGGTCSHAASPRFSGCPHRGSSALCSLVTGLACPCEPALNLQGGQSHQGPEETQQGSLELPPSHADSSPRAQWAQAPGRTSKLGMPLGKVQACLSRCSPLSPGLAVTLKWSMYAKGTDSALAWGAQSLGSDRSLPQFPHLQCAWSSGGSRVEPRVTCVLHSPFHSEPAPSTSPGQSSLGVPVTGWCIGCREHGHQQRPER